VNRASFSPATLLTGLAVLVVVVALHAAGLLRPLESLVGVVLRPFSSLAHLGGKSDLERQNEDLRTKVDLLTAEVAAREEAKQQNDALRAQLGFAQSGNYALAQANIISQDPTNYQQVLTIDRGSSAGIGKGMVVVSQGLLVGRITETTTGTAKVYLITDFNSAVPALDQQSRAAGLVRGQRGFGLSLEMVPQTDTLSAGDTLLTSGFGGEFPAGLVIGTVGDIHRRDAEVFQQAAVNPAVDFRKLEYVFVITGQR
jgi:rod shape-determining protein MreC